MPMKPATPRSRILALSISHHTLYTYGVAPPRFLWDSDAPEPRFGETQTLVEKFKLPVYPFDRR